MNSNLKTRIITAALLIPLVIIALFTSPLLFQLLLLVVALGMLTEWYDITSSSILDALFGLVVIAIPMGSLFLVTLNREDYRYLILVYLLNIWMIDTCAMLGGKALQGPKLSPVISPNKTWSGLVCGMIGSVFVLLIFDRLWGTVFIYEGLELIPFGIMFTVVAQASDLLVSFFKRKFHVKDSGALLPGHGGILDRCDSLILTAPLLWYVAQ